MSNATARTYLVGLLTGSGLGLLAGWILNSAYWFNGSTGATPVVAGITSVLCGAGTAIYAWGRRSGASGPSEDS